MSYTKTNWQTGDTITAEKLNHAEQGIYDNSTSGGVLVVHDVDETLDKTWQEIHDADFAVLKITYNENFISTSIILGTEIDHGVYMVYFGHNGEDTIAYMASSASGYPTIPDQPES